MSELNPILLIAIPLFAAFSIPILSIFNKKVGFVILPLTVLFNLILSVKLFPKVLIKPINVLIAGYKSPIGINLAITPLSLFLAILISFIGLLVAIHLMRGIFYKTGELSEVSPSKLSILVLLLIMGSTGIVLTGDIFNLFVFIEIMSIASYSLTAIKQDELGTEGAFKFILAGSISSVLLLLAIALIYNQLGTLNMAEIASSFSKMQPTVITAVLIMMFVGLGIEGELFPFNGWSPDVYTGAPYPVAVLFSGVTVKAALYVFVRFFFTIAGSQMLSLILAVGVATLFVSEFAALKQKNVKRMLGYSSLGQLGLIVIAFGTATSLSVQGAMFHFVNHAILKGVLFLTLAYFVEHTNSPLIENLKGIGRKMPFAGFMFALSALAVTGMPPFNGFMSKLMILSALAKESSMVLIASILFASVVEGVYYFRVLQVIFTKPESDNQVKTEGAYFYYVPVVVLGILIVAIGLNPGIITQYLPKVAEELLDKSIYIKGMVGGAL